MKLMRCPVNGVRPIQEFAYGGPIRPEPDSKTVSVLVLLEMVISFESIRALLRR